MIDYSSQQVIKFAEQTGISVVLPPVISKMESAYLIKQKDHNVILFNLINFVPG